MKVDNHKTKNLHKSLKNFDFNSALFIHIDDASNENFKRASSNIPRLAMLSDKGLNVRDLMTFEKIFIETKAVEKNYQEAFMNNKLKSTTEERALNIIYRPLMTEKSTNLNQYNQYSFIVSKDSNVIEIKSAIERIFKVKVTKVNTSILKGKIKSFKGSSGYRKDLKKAIVTLAEGNTIDSSLDVK